jgi:hypothetical protein
MRSGVVCFLALVVCGLPAVGQHAAASGTVTGHVSYADTNSPARMVRVTLQAVGDVDALRSKDTKRVTSYMQAVQTLLDGSFSVRNVSPGTYYVIVSAPGYISPMNLMEQARSDSSVDSATKAKLAAAVPRVTVQANVAANVNVTLERGGAVSGTILYDDGSPASGLDVTLLVRQKDAWGKAPTLADHVETTSAMTDDRGNYRIGGLPAQKYMVEVVLNLSSYWMTTDNQGSYGMSTQNSYSISIFSDNKMRAKDAKPFDLNLGEERTDEDIQVPIGKLHSVRGTVTAARDSHAVNGGKVTLLYPDDKSPLAEANISRDAEFDFSFVPEGDYLLHIDNAADTEYKDVPNPPGSVPPEYTSSHAVQSYGTAEVPIHVGNDMTGVTIAVPDLKKAGN